MDAPESIQIYFGSKEKYIEFIKKIVGNNIRKIVFVSKKSEETFYNIMDKEYIIKNNIKTFTIKNYIDGEEIIKKAKEFKEIENDEKYYILKDILEENKKGNNTIFLNVGRHSKEKNLNMMIKVCNNIIRESEKESKKKVYLFMIGEGDKTEELKKYVEENGLEENIIFLGKKKNPYPYFLISDYIILTSLTEGYPVVFQEAMVLRKRYNNNRSI